MRRLISIIGIVMLCATSALALTGGGGGSFNAAAPGAIGGTTPSTGTFTALTAGNSSTADPAIQINASSSNNSNIAFGGGTANSFGYSTSQSKFIWNVASFGYFSLGAQYFSGIGGATIQSTGGSIPQVTCSGGSTGTSVAAGSTNNRGQIVTSSSASTNCTITWSGSGTWNQAPFCVFADGGASITPVAYSTGACGTATCVVDFASTTSKTINYVCM